MNNFPPSVTVIDSTVELGSVITMDGRFTVDDIDPDSVVTRYRFRDSNTAAQSGYFLLDGVPWQQGLILEVDASDLHRVTYRSAAIISSELVTIEAYDGLFWSDPGAGTFYSVVPNVNPPVVVGSDISVVAFESVLVENFISAFDPDGYPIEEYWFIDGVADQFGGYFSLNGVQMPSVTWFSVMPEELGDLRYHGATYGNSEAIAVLARDRSAWSELTFFDAHTAPNLFDPTVVANEIDLLMGGEIDVAEMFTYSDVDGNSMKWVEVKDLGVAPNSGYFRLNGVPIAGGNKVRVNHDELDQLQYVAGTEFGSELFEVQVWDGARLSTISSALVNSGELPRVDVARILMVDSFEFVRLGDVLDIETSITPISYEFIDLNDDLTSGSLNVNGFDLAAHEVHVVSSSDFSETFFRGGADDLGRSFDEYLVRVDTGFAKSAWTKINVSTDPVNEEGVLGLGFWNFPTPSLELTYNFPTTVPSYYCTGGYDQCDDNAPLEPNMRAAVRDALDIYETFFDVRYIEVSALELADVSFMLTDAVPDAGAFAYAPGTVGVYDVAGDQWGTLSEGGLQFTNPGEFGHFVWLHENGHSLGLTHSFSGNPVLPEPMDNSRYSVMSYTGAPEFQNSGGGELFPATPMLYDVMALQTLYGANPTYRLGDTQIKIPANSNLPHMVYDAGGTDTFNLNSHTASAEIDLRQGQFSSVGGVVDNVGIAWGVDIENARGGKGNDEVRGNELANLLFGNNGNDVLEGRGGQDLLRGMAGNDTFVWSIGDGFDVIREEYGAGRDEIHVNLFDEYDTDLNTLTDVFQFRRFGNDLLIDLHFDGEAAHGGLRVHEMAFGKNRVETLRLFDIEGEQIGPNISLVSIFAGATVTPQQFELTTNTSRFGNLAVPVV